jgi:folate-binding Fe-S cluster repair protein YgfZ
MTMKLCFLQVILSFKVTNSNQGGPQATLNTTLTDIISRFQANFLSFNFNKAYYLEFGTENCTDITLDINHVNKYKGWSKKDETGVIKSLCW